MIPEAYFPLRTETFGMTLGIRPLDPHERLIHRDPACFAAELALKAAQLAADRDEYVQMLAGTHAAQLEAVALLAQDTGISLPADLEANPSPLLWFGMQVQEDLCLLDASLPEVPLVAGAVFFPGDWSMREKIGRSFIDVHAPVPMFADTIGVPSVNLLERMKFDRPVWRPNWGGLKPTDQLDLTPKHSAWIHTRKFNITAENAGRELCFRVERQTLSKLPRTNHVLFTIRTYQSTLADVCANPLWRRNLVGWFDTAPAEWIAYKGMTPFLDAVHNYLRALR